jgi:hypothetical protein
MKTLLLILPFVLSASLLHAADSALPEFNSKLSGHPPLSLNEIIKQPMPAKPPHVDLLEPRPTLSRSAPESRVTRDSGMPILQPDPKVDYKMIVKAPDPTVDFKLIVKSPELAK